MIKIILHICIILPVTILANNIEITLERNISSPNPLDIIVKVTNTSDEDVFIEPSDYPYKSGNTAKNLFTVLEDGEKVSYIGFIALVTPHPKKIIAGTTYTSHINITKLYKLSQGTHNYEIYYSNINKSNTLEIEATIASHKYKQRKIAGYHRCSTSAMSILRGDHARAQSYTQNVVNTLPKVDRNHILYQKWFGYADPGRYNAVYENYKKIYAGFNQNVTYSCNSNQCEPGFHAVIVKTQPYNINICSGYWRNPDNSRATTLVHEMSHFWATVGTVDGNGIVKNPYKGPTGAQNLAKIRPDLAIRNAYSYGYYAKELALNKPATSTPTTTPSTGSSSPRYYNFNSTKNTEGWRAGNLRDAYGGPVNGAWFFQVSYNDPQLYSPTLNINANVIKKITIRMANAFNPAQFNLLQVFWKGSGQGFSEANSQVISVYNHGGWVTYTIDLSRNPRWQGNIEQIRIDPLIAGDGHWIAIDSISLTR